MEHAHQGSLKPMEIAILISNPARKHNVFWREVHEIKPFQRVAWTRHDQTIFPSSLPCIVKEVGIVIVCIVTVAVEAFLPPRDYILEDVRVGSVSFPPIDSHVQNIV